MQVLRPMRPHRRWTAPIALALLAFLVPSSGVGQAMPDEEARRLAADALEAMGGAALWRDLSGLELRTIGHNLWLEQSERPEGPWVVGYEQQTLSFDYEGDRVRRTVESRDFQTPEWRSITTLVDRGTTAITVNGRVLLAPPALQEEVRELRTVLPDRALLAALQAPDLRREADRVLQGVPHHVVAYARDGRPIRLILNARTSLPTAVQTLGPEDDVYTVVWGDEPTTYYFSLWSLEPGGYVFPRQWDVEEAGRLRASATVTSVDFSPDIDPASVRIPEDVRNAPSPFADWSFRRQTLGERQGRPVAPIEVAPGLIVLPGAWNTVLVVQDDGVVVIETPISSEYSRQVIGEVERRFPDLSIKAAISTSDAWPHVSGVREYVARGIPVYALDLNAPLLRKLAASEHRRVPDLQSERRRAPDFRTLADPLAVGDGANRMELYPVRGEGGERMIAVYFPGHEALYASDLVQRRPDGTFFMPEYLIELMDVVNTHRLEVETVFAMHTDPVPWTEVPAAIEKTRSASGG